METPAKSPVVANGSHGDAAAAMPSLLRVGLSAGFASLSQKDSKGSKAGGYRAAARTMSSRSATDATAEDDSDVNAQSILSSPEEEEATLAILEAAENIARGSSSQQQPQQQSQEAMRELTNNDPATFAALSAMGEYSHSSRGVLVNVIDPTTPSGTSGVPVTTPSSLPNIPDTPPSGGKGLFGNFNRGEAGISANGGAEAASSSSPVDTSSLNIYSRLASTFSDNYNSTLHSLPFVHPRTSTRHQIPSLPVRFGLTMQPISDPADWHDGPYCHVYIAAVENIDHYRAKVRPALRAFVNQIEGSGTTASTAGAPAGKKQMAASPNTPGSAASPTIKGKKSANEKALAKAGLAAGKSALAGNFGSKYIIVFVPIGSGGSGSSGSVSGGKGTPGGFGGFRGRKGQSGGVVLSGSGDGNDDQSSAATATTSSSTHDGSQTSSQQHTAAAAAALPPGPIAHSSKETKELYHKFAKDFPNGRTVILGTLLDASLSSPLKNQEWKAFLHNLGGAIVDGFQDRVRRYDEELRRLDSRRTAFVRKLSGEGIAQRPPSAWKDEGSNFDLSHFFLVKESLAFTYEQMQLSEEAKLQYEELDAFLPEGAWRTLARRDTEGSNGKKQLSGNESGETTAVPSDLAMAGDSEGFRRHIKQAGGDLRGVSRYIPRYMYSRQVRLLFRMGTAVDALVLAKDFLTRSYRDRLQDTAVDFQRRWKEEVEGVGVDSSGEEILSIQAKLREERSRREAEAEAWALSSCWDIRSAAAHYFAFATSTCGDEVKDAATTMEDVEAARCIAELLEFAILRLMRLGDLALSDIGAANPVRQATSERPADTIRPWEPWHELRQRLKAEPEEEQKSDEDETWPSILAVGSGVSPWLRDAIAGPSAYERTYLELAQCAVLLNRIAGRHRTASRLEDHRAEVLIARGDCSLAASVLSNNTVGAGYARDQWTRAHYWRLFRLACCQRMSGDVLAYLETLTQSFNPKLKDVAPSKTALLFQRDLEALITDAAVADVRWGAFPFLETELAIVTKEDAGKVFQPLPFLRRKLTKDVCFVGDELSFSLGINSRLPQPIAVNGVRLYLITLDKYEQVYRRNGIITEDDAFRILSIDEPIDIKPGQNEFTFSWQPMTFGTYVLATVEIQWKEASFFYDRALLRKPMIGLEIQPSEPTQTIELNPLFLIPGHVQNVRLVFNSGSDIITDGRVRLVCSEGLQVAPPKTDPSKLDEAWSNECVIPLDACAPGKKIVVTTLVKSSNVKHDDGADGVQTMRAKVETHYRQASYPAVMAKGEEPESDPMTTHLEAMVTTLDRPALTVDDAEAFVFGENHVMVNISLQCNSPVPFYVKEWHLDLPPPLVVEKDGDLNGGMFNHAIPEGEVLMFGFKCIRTDSAELVDRHCERPLLRVVLQDDFSKTFLQVMPVNLDRIYNKIRKEDSYAELYTATADLTCSAEEGTVGHPVPFVFDVNLQSLMNPRQRKTAGAVNAPGASVAGCPVLYTIISDDSDWIVSGKVQGLINLSPGSESLSLHFRGIPTQSGILRNFPELYLEYLPAKGGADLDASSCPPITVQCNNPDRFQSFAYTTSLSLAVPATLEEC
ncbi:hypothetical protein ACHAXT_012229 [Thalassiosira profunda]